LNKERGRIEILHASQQLRTPFQDAVLRGYDLLQTYGKENTRVWIDAANPEYIASLKSMIREKPTNYQDAVKELKERGYTQPYQLAKKIVIHAIPFSTEGRRMLGHVKALMDDERRLLAIHPMFTDLITALRTARSDDALGLLKSEMVNADVMDACRLSLNHWQIGRQQQQKEQQQQQQQQQNNNNKQPQAPTLLRIEKKISQEGTSSPYYL
jgi:hypothetical protein